MSAPTWQDLAALEITQVLDGRGLAVEGQDWDADIEDADGDLLPPGQLYLTCQDGRTVLVQVTVTVIEGTLT